MVEWARRLRVRPRNRASGGLGRHCPAQLHGSVRQRAGGADESGGNPVESRAFVNGRPCPFPEGGPGDEGKRRGGAPIGAPARVMGRLFPSAEGTGFAVRRATGCGVPHQRLSALCPPRMGDIPRQRPGARSPGAMEFGSMTTCSLSCPAHAGHPVITNVSDYWIARRRGR